jgi:hypothetical protein
VLLLPDDREWALPLLDEAVDAAFDGAHGRWLGHPALLAAKRHELRRTLHRFLDAELEHNRKLFVARANNYRTVRTGVVEHELGFSDVVLERGGVRFRYRGWIDRVETGIDGDVPSERFLSAVDYKSSRYAAPGGASKDSEKQAWLDRVVLQVPLYAHALATLRPGAEVARVEYRELRKGEPVHRLELVEVDRKEGVVIVAAEARAKLDAALDAVAAHVLDIRRGEFPAAPAESCGCPPYCHALEICRVKGGPRVGDR